jgi:hypothetical protein
MKKPRLQKQAGFQAQTDRSRLLVQGLVVVHQDIGHFRT